MCREAHLVLRIDKDSACSTNPPHAAAGKHLAIDRARNVEERETAVGIVEADAATAGLAAAAHLRCIVAPVFPGGLENERGDVLVRIGEIPIPVSVDEVAICSDYQRL